jgi:hypothetical protein
MGCVLHEGWGIRVASVKSEGSLWLNGGISGAEPGIRLANRLLLGGWWLRGNRLASLLMIKATATRVLAVL